MSLQSFDDLWDTGLIIISSEEITRCYLVHSKSVLSTRYYCYFTAKLACYRLECFFHIDIYYLKLYLPFMMMRQIVPYIPGSAVGVVFVPAEHMYQHTQLRRNTKGRIYPSKDRWCFLKAVYKRLKPLGSLIYQLSNQNGNSADVRVDAASGLGVVGT